MSDELSLNALRERISQAIQTLLNVLVSKDDSVLNQAMCHTFTPNSKLIRPTLLAATALDLGAQPSILIDYAVTAIECVHVYSLIHDDLPAMDDDALRRGQPSCHIAFDEATAILAGDALLTLAFDLLANPNLGQPRKQCQLIHTLTQASGHHGMALGQALDLEHMQTNTPLDTLETIYRLKTSKLIEAAVRMGAIIALGDNQTIPEPLIAFSQALGLAFQIQDDILDIELSEEESGKPQLSDAERTKPTYPSILGLDQAKTQVKDLKALCLKHLNSLTVKVPLMKNSVESVLK